MKYYSEVTKQVYDSEAACYAAERKEKAKSDQRKKDAESVEAARKAYSDALDASAKAREEYEKVLADFCKKYGAYHTSVSWDKDGGSNVNELRDIIRTLLF